MKPRSSLPPFIRLCLTIAIVTGIAVSTVGLISIRSKIITLRKSLKTETAARQAAEHELNRTKQTLAHSVAELKETKGALIRSETERNQTVAEARAQGARAEQLDKALKNTRFERDEAKDALARYTNTRLTPEQVMATANTIQALQASIAAVEAENGLLIRKVKLLAKLEPNTFPERPVPLPANLVSKIKVTDAKWNFVALDAGSQKGMLEQAELLVSRHGKLVGKVKVRRVEKDRSFADLLPGWNFGELIEGDVAVPANPET
jgi:hypothetical protein